MILREFTRANQGPDKLAQPGFAVPALRQNGLKLLYFFDGGRAGERGEIELAENLLIGCARLQQLCQAAIGLAEPVYIGRSSEHVHRLAEVRFVVPFRNRAAVGPSVQLQKPREESVGIAQLNRARTGRGLPHSGTVRYGRGEGL